jgi:hypothetical protein
MLGVNHPVRSAKMIVVDHLVLGAAHAEAAGVGIALEAGDDPVGIERRQPSEHDG